MANETLTRILLHNPRVYAIVVGATRSRSTLYYKLLVVQADRNPLDITALACEALNLEFKAVYKALTYPGYWGALHALLAGLQRTTVGESSVLSIKLL
jgi:hypothetical protein